MVNNKRWVLTDPRRSGLKVEGDVGRRLDVSGCLSEVHADLNVIPGECCYLFHPFSALGLTAQCSVV